MSLKVLITLFIFWGSCPSFAKPADFRHCKEVSLIQTSPGSNWKDFDKYFDKHLEFIRANMQNGKILFSGPLLELRDAEGGGLSITNLTNIKDIEAMLAPEPFIIHKVHTYSVKKWKMCQLASEIRP